MSIQIKSLCIGGVIGITLGCVLWRRPKFLPTFEFNHNGRIKKNDLCITTRHQALHNFLDDCKNNEISYFKMSDECDRRYRYINVKCYTIPPDQKTEENELQPATEDNKKEI